MFFNFRKYERAVVKEEYNIHEFKAKTNKITNYADLQLQSRKIYYKIIYNKIFST